MAAVTELATAVGTRAACRALFAPRASHYRQRHASICPAKLRPRPAPPRALAPAERETILAHLHGERFQDRSPAAVYATLLDEGEYHCSIRTMYRLLTQRGESRERRDQLTHPPYQKPELMATAPNQLWSLGHHQTAGARQVDLLLSLRDPRCLQSLRHRLDGSDAGKRRAGQAADRGELHETKHPARTTHAACRSRYGDGFQAGGLLTGRLGCHQNAQPPARLRRQSVFGKPLPHHEVPTGVSGSFRLHSRQPGFFARIFPLVQRRTSPLRLGVAHAGHGPLQANRAHPRTAPNRSRCRLSRPSRTLRPPGSQTSSGPHRGVDQQTAQHR